MPGQDELPSTVKRSDAHAQAIWTKTHDAAVEEYGEGERAHRTAFAALKHSYEKMGDHWEPKPKRGPSDPRAASSGPDPEGASFGGVNVLGRTRAELLELAKRLGLRGVSHLRKTDLAHEIEQANQRATAKARS